jgi:general secretion pathway protein G
VSPHHIFRSSTRQGRILRDVVGVIVVMAVLAAVGFLLSRTRNTTDARSLTVDRLEATMDGLNKYALDNAGDFPTTDQGLQALVEQPSLEPEPLDWRGPYVQDPRDLEDGWGREFHYLTPGAGDPPRAYDLWSAGADNQEGGSGEDADIKSWARESWLPPSQ